MTLDIARRESVARFNEAQVFLSQIRSREPDGMEPTSAAVNIEKGLFMVLLYGAVEYSLCKLLSEVAILISLKGIQYTHLHESIYALALHPELVSAANVGRNKRWNRRADIFRKQVSNDVASLDASPVIQDLDNVWAHTFGSAFMVFGITADPLYDPKVRQYIDEIAERRNAVAHGRESAVTVGRAYTTARLQKMLEEVSTQIQYMFAQFELALDAKTFIKSNFHQQY